MNIGELARRTGLTTSRIRFYESAGLLRTVARRANGYRTYPPETVSALKLITTAQQVGFSLEEIRVLLPDDSKAWDRSELLLALRRKVCEIEALENRLLHGKTQLLALMHDVQARPDGRDRVVDAQRVLSRVFGKTD